MSTDNWAIIIHGGASDDRFSDPPVAQKRPLLLGILDIGTRILAQGGSALDAVQIVIEALENSPAFNAGKGSVISNERMHELDAAIMDGATLCAGAVASVRDIRNPIRVARKVMEHGEHVLLIGRGASIFAQEQGIDMVDNSYFSTSETEAEWQRIKAGNAGFPIGTVGCVALDKQGNLVAGTSTGGMSGKKYGRVGDSPIIGAGTYANNQSVAVSCTGHGELFIRRAVAFDINALVLYCKMSVEEACKMVIWDKIHTMKGAGGGVIALDKHGNMGIQYSTRFMYHAYANSQGIRVALP